MHELQFKLLNNNVPEDAEMILQFCQLRQKIFTSPDRGYRTHYDLHTPDDTNADFAVLYDPQSNHVVGGVALISSQRATLPFQRMFKMLPSTKLREALPNLHDHAHIMQMNGMVMEQANPTVSLLAISQLMNNTIKYCTSQHADLILVTPNVSMEKALSFYMAKKGLPMQDHGQMAYTNPEGLERSKSVQSIVLNPALLGPSVPAQHQM